MKTSFTTFAVALAASCFPIVSLAADPSPSASPAASSAPAGATKVYDANDVEAIRPQLNQTVTITGTVNSQGESKTGTVRFLHFGKDWNKSVALVFFVKAGEPSHDQLLNYVGKKIRVSGKLVEYQKQLELKLESPSVIEILP